MDPTDYHIRNIVHDWEEHEKREERYYKVLPTQVKTQMILLNDAVWLFSKGLSELQILDELSAPEIECKRKKPWQHGRRIIEFMKAVSELYVKTTSSLYPCIYLQYHYNLYVGTLRFSFLPSIPTVHINEFPVSFNSLYQTLSCSVVFDQVISFLLSKPLILITPILNQSMDSSYQFFSTLLHEEIP